MLKQKVALITGAGKRVGADMARALHAQGLHIIIHYRHSAEEAQSLCKLLNEKREQSAITIQKDLNEISSLNHLIDEAICAWGQVDVLINNASSFYSTPLHSANEKDWDQLFNSNLKAPFFLSQAIASHLVEQRGCIINMLDIRARVPLKDYSIYCIAKAGLLMMTKVLAKELAPHVRVNGIAPGVVLWPDSENDLVLQKKIIDRTLLRREGSPDDVVKAVLFLINNADYITGQVITIDGGRSLDY